MPESSQPSHTPKQPAIMSNGPGKERSLGGLSQRFVDALGWIITGIWALSMIFNALKVGYEPPASIHVLMMIVAGTAFGTNFIKPKNGGDE